MDNTQEKALEAVLTKLNKKFGNTSPIGYMPELVTPLERFSSGSLAVDYVCGDKFDGGIPKGRTVTLYGPSSGGKTTLALQIGAACQKQGGVVAIVDAESTITEEYCQALGMDTSKLIVTRPETGNEAADIIRDLVNSTVIDLVILDSINALVPQDNFDKSFTDNEKMAADAKLQTQLLKRITLPLSNTKTTLLLIAQTRANVNQATPYSPKEILGGSKAVEFFSSIIVKVSKRSAIKEGDEIIGNVCVATVEKNKTAAPGRKAEFTIYFGRGVSREKDLINMGLRTGVLSQSAGWFKYNGENLIRGEESLREMLENNPAKAKEIEDQIRSVMSRSTKGMATEEESGNVEDKQD